MNLKKGTYHYFVHIPSRRLLLLLALVSFATLPLSVAQTGAAGSTPCPLVIGVSHFTKSCLEKDLSNIPTPLVDAPCSVVDNLTFKDTFFELAQSSYSSFSGYFDLSRWEKKSGDGGVDVTGAPNCILVEGANIARFNVAPGRVTILRIAIPAKGYAAFNWKNIGGSNLLFSAIVNNKVYPIKTKNFYRSPLLQAGDMLSLQMENTSEIQIETQLSDFQFFTNATSVIERRWTATDDRGNTASTTQFITIEPLPLANIIFPKNFDRQSMPALKSNEPAFTGFPVYDQDGNDLTTHDQQILNASNCAFSISWKDELTTGQYCYMLLRRWSVADGNGNVREHSQIIHLQDISNFNIESEQTSVQPSSVKASSHKSSAISNDSPYNSLIISQFIQQPGIGEQLAALVATNKNNANVQ